MVHKADVVEYGVHKNLPSSNRFRVVQTAPDLVDLLVTIFLKEKWKRLEPLWSPGRPFFGADAAKKDDARRKSTLVDKYIYKKKVDETEKHRPPPPVISAEDRAQNDVVIATLLDMLIVEDEVYVFDPSIMEPDKVDEAAAASAGGALALVLRL